MSPRRRPLYEPDQEKVFLSRSEANKLVAVNYRRAFGELKGYWILPDDPRRCQPFMVYRMSDVLALRRNGARAADSSRQAQG